MTADSTIEKVKIPSCRPAHRHEQPVKNMQRLDQPRHGIHRNAGAEHRHHGKRAGVQRARLFVEAQPQKLRHRARLRAVIERHHEDAHEDHGRNGADAVEVRRLQAVFGARRAHADHFLRAQVGADKRQPADPRRQRAPRLEEVLARLHVALQGKADAQHKHEVQQHDQPIDGGEFQDCSLQARYGGQCCATARIRNQLYAGRRRRVQRKMKRFSLLPARTTDLSTMRRSLH